MVKIGPKPQPSRPCPVCGKPNSDDYRPFCGKRCADVDLGRWFGETYRVPTDENLGENPDNDDPEA